MADEPSSHGSRSKTSHKQLKHTCRWEKTYLPLLTQHVKVRPQRLTEIRWSKILRRCFWNQVFKTMVYNPMLFILSSMEDHLMISVEHNPVPITSISPSTTPVMPPDGVHWKDVAAEKHLSLF